MKSISPALVREVRGLRERVESQNCHIATLERQLRTLLGTTGLGPVSVQAHAPAATPRRWRARPAPRMPAPDRAFWPTPDDESRPLAPAPGLRAYALKGTPLKVIGVSVCGFSRAEIEPIVEFIEQHQSRDRQFVPVFLTDSTDANIFRRRGFVFEYLPPPERVRLPGSKSWADYAAERRRLLALKWGMADIITFGDVAFGRPKDTVDAKPVRGDAEKVVILRRPKTRAGRSKHAGVGACRNKGGGYAQRRQRA
jgi:hypothetical protein